MKTKKRILEILLAACITFVLTKVLIYNLLLPDWPKVFVSVVALFGIAFPFLFSYLASRRQINLPSRFSLSFLIFIFASLYLGELLNYYEKYWWWDLILHLVGGMLIVVIGFFVNCIINGQEQGSLNQTPFFVSLFAFTFGVMLSTFWEIFEFLADSILGTHMIKYTINDTMTDIIITNLGSIWAAAIYYSQGRRNRNKMPP